MVGYSLFLWQNGAPGIHIIPYLDCTGAAYQKHRVPGYPRSKYSRSRGVDPEPPYSTRFRVSATGCPVLSPRQGSSTLGSARENIKIHGRRSVLLPAVQPKTAVAPVRFHRACQPFVRRQTPALCTSKRTITGQYHKYLEVITSCRHLVVGV